MSLTSEGWDKRTREEKQKGRDVLRDITTSLNVMGGEENFADGFIEELNKTHRTLQQNVGRLLLRVVKHFAKQHEELRYDGRNEAICELCAHLDRASQEHGDYMPFI